MAVVTELNVFPVKSARGVALAESPVVAAGLLHDRGFMAVGPGGVFRTQRRDPRLAVVRPWVDAAGERLTLNAPGAAELRVEVDLTAPRTPVDLFGEPYLGIDQGDAAAGWLTGVLGAPSRLVRVPPEHRRVTGGLTPGTAGYADGGAVHLIGRGSLDELDRRLAAAGRPPVPVERFRANIVVDGWAEPHREDRARLITIGGAELAFAKPAIRCAVTMVDQGSGGRAGPEPLRTLATYRRAPEGGVAFGAKFSVLRPGKISVGDEVVVGA